MLYDISVLVDEETPPWPGDSPFTCNWSALIADGSSVNLSTVSGSPHVGTHADAPLHVADGMEGSESLPVAAFIGRALVVDATGRTGQLDREWVYSQLPHGEIERLLLRTDRGIAGGAFPEDWPVLAEDCLLHLLGERGLRLLGVDAPSVDEKTSKRLPNHHEIFRFGANILENLDLRDIEAGQYELVALPLRVGGLDAAPVRAFLRPA